MRRLNHLVAPVIVHGARGRRPPGGSAPLRRGRGDRALLRRPCQRHRVGRVPRRSSRRRPRDRRRSRRGRGRPAARRRHRSGVGGGGPRATRRVLGAPTGRSACAVGAAITAERLAEDRAFDLSAGNAGALLAFLSLYATTGSEEWLTRARTCGDLLLTHRDGRPAAWPRPEGPPLTGLSHGAAGIAHRCSHSPPGRKTHVRRRRARGAALRTPRFLPAVGNWEDLRPGGPSRGPKVMYAWCNGAPGIGLARLPWCDVDDEMPAKSRSPWRPPGGMFAARRTTSAAGRSGASSCCSRGGRVSTARSPHRGARGRRRGRRRRPPPRPKSPLLAGSTAGRRPGTVPRPLRRGFQLLRLAFPERCPPRSCWTDAFGVRTEIGLGRRRAGCGLRKPVHHAARAYPWMSPPRRSRRWT